LSRTRPRTPKSPTDHNVQDSRERRRTQREREEWLQIESLLHQGPSDQDSYLSHGTGSGGECVEWKTAKSEARTHNRWVTSAMESYRRRQRGPQTEGYGALREQIIGNSADPKRKGYGALREQIFKSSADPKWKGYGALTEH